MASEEGVSAHPLHPVQMTLCFNGLIFPEALLALPRPEPALENSGVKISLSLPPLPPLPEQLQVTSDERIIALFLKTVCKISTVISPEILLLIFNFGVMRNKEADGEVSCHGAPPSLQAAGSCSTPWDSSKVGSKPRGRAGAGERSGEPQAGVWQALVCNE